MSEPDRAASGGRDRGAAVAFAALAVEAGLMAGVVFYGMGLAAALGLHALVVAALGLRCRHVFRTAGDTGTPALLTAGVAVAGPFGALGGLLIDWLSKQGQEHRDRLQRWYDRISLSIDTDDVTKLSDHVVIGRGMDLGGAPPAPFARLLEHGSVAEQQAVLGLVARRFHLHYLAALKTGLVSDEPVIRVQAAAVAARVRGTLGAEVDRLLAALGQGGSAAEMLRLCSDIDQCVASGLLEEKQNARAQAASVEARARAVERLAAAARPALVGARVAADGGLGDLAARQALEDALLGRERYDDFRRLRRAFAFPVKGRMRFRIGRWPGRRTRKFAVVTGGSLRP